MDFLVYIDTNLGHNFVMIVSDSDTVCDIKGKIVLEYADCFPQMGEINVHAIKIDLRGTSYRLSESMLIGKVFEATIGARLLHVDASSTGPKHNKIRLSEDFLITRKENGDRNGTLLRIENNGSHLLQHAPDIPCHPNRDDNSSVYGVSASPKMKSKGTKSIITTSGTSRSECGKEIDVPRVQKEVDYSHVLLKNGALAVLGQNGSIEQGKESRKRKDWEKLTNLQNDNQSEIVSSGPRKKKHRRKKEKEHVDAKFDIDKSQAVCKEILGKKSEENVLGCTNGPKVIENKIDLISPSIPKVRKKRKKTSDTFPSLDIGNKHKYSFDTTSGHLTLKLTKDDIGIVEKSLANKNRDFNISLKKAGNTSSVSIPEPKNALAAAEKLTEEIQGLSSTPVSESAFEKEQVTLITKEFAQDVRKKNITDLVLTSHSPASLPQKISSLSEGLGDFGFQEDVDLVIPSKDDVSTAILSNNYKRKRHKKKKKGKHSGSHEVKNALVADENVERSLADKKKDPDIPMKNIGNTFSLSSLEIKNALVAAEKVNEDICRQSASSTSELPCEKREEVTLITMESAQDFMKRKVTELGLRSPTDATAQPGDFETPDFIIPASSPQKIPSLSEGLGDFSFQEDVNLVIPSKDDVLTDTLANNGKRKQHKKKQKGKHSDNHEAKNALVASENVEKSLADKNRDPDIPMKNTENTFSLSSLEIKNTLVAVEKVNKDICRQSPLSTSELPCEKREEVTLITMESAQDFMKGNITEPVLTSPCDAKAQPGHLETPDFRIPASLPQQIPSLSEVLDDFGFHEDVDHVIPLKDGVSIDPLASSDKRKRRKKKKKGYHSDNVEANNALVAAENVEKSFADKNRDPDFLTKSTLSISSLETKEALVAAEKVIEDICRQLTPTSEFSFEKEQATLIGKESAQYVMNKNNTHLVLTSSPDAITQTGDLEALDFRRPTSLPQQIPSLLGGLGDFGLQEDVDPVIPSKVESTFLLVNNDKSEQHKKRKKCINNDMVEPNNAHVAAKNVDKSLADKNGHPYIPMKNTSASFLETKNTLDATDMVIEENYRQSTPSFQSPFEKEQVTLIADESAQDTMNENNTELVLMSPLDAKTHTLVNSCISEYVSPSIADHNSSPLLKNVRKLQKADEHPVKDGCMSVPNEAPLNDTLKYPKPVVGEVNFAEFFFPDIVVAQKGSIASPECTGNNGHILNSKYRELQEESITRELICGEGEKKNIRRNVKSKRDLKKSNVSMHGSQVMVPHPNVHIPCESTHISNETNLTGIQTRNSHAKSIDKMAHDGVALTDLESQEFSDNKSHKFKGKASLVNKKTEDTMAFKLETKMSKIPRKSNSNVADHSADAGKETNVSLSVFDSKPEGRNERYQIAVRKVPGGLFEKLDSSKTEKQLPFDSLSIFDHIFDDVSKDEDVDNVLTC